MTNDSGTGIVHQAPGFGEDDYRVCMAHGVIQKGEKLPCPVDEAGCYTAEVHDLVGVYVKDADKIILKKLKERGRLIRHTQTQHSYPFCWRSDTPLIYKAVPSWFVRVENIVEDLLRCNAETKWFSVIEFSCCRQIKGARVCAGEAICQLALQRA